MYAYLSEEELSHKFTEDTLFWNKKGLVYGDWESGPDSDGTYTYSGKIDASEVTHAIKYT